MILWLILGVIVLLLILLFLIFKNVYNIAYDQGFKYGYLNNPVINQSIVDIEESIDLLNSITVYKNNKIVVKRVIQILKLIDEEFKASAENEKKSNNKSSFNHYFQKLKAGFKLIIFQIFVKTKKMLNLIKEELKKTLHKES